jgi:formylmethanofuran dehydrogenase subunit C
MSITLRWLSTTTLPVEAEGLNPLALSGMTAAQVASRTVPVGNSSARVGELFEVNGDGTEGANDELRLEGDLRHLRGLGRGMTGGLLTVTGDVGAHLGAGMSAGRIEVAGNVGDWAGAEMKGGLIRIRGNAGRALGAGYPGRRLGMREGVILVEGAVGEGAGRRMRRGLIAVLGEAGDSFGSRLIAGSLFAFGAVGRYTGAGMKRGTLVLGQEHPPRLLPSFVPTGRYRFPFLMVYLRRLLGWGFPVPDRVFSADFERYNGDLADHGQGEVLVLAGSDER